MPGFLLPDAKPMVNQAFSIPLTREQKDLVGAPQKARGLASVIHPQDIRGPGDGYGRPAFRSARRKGTGNNSRAFADCAP